MASKTPKVDFFRQVPSSMKLRGKGAVTISPRDTGYFLGGLMGYEKLRHPPQHSVRYPVMRPI